MNGISTVVVRLAAIAAIALSTLVAVELAPCLAQVDGVGGDSISTSPDAEVELTIHQKVIRWARPSMEAAEIDALLQEIEHYASRFSVDYDFAVALVATEASLHPIQAFSRQWSSLMELKRTYSYDTLDAPPIWNDLPNAISTIRMAIDETRQLPHATDRTLRNALARYWMGPAKGKNTDSFDRFYSVFKEKYKAILVAQNKEFTASGTNTAIVPDDIAGFMSKLPRMEELDKRIRSWDVEGVYAKAIRNFNPRLDDATSLLFARTILSFSSDAGIDPRLVVALIHCESGFNPRARSGKGAIGLGQIMPATARSFGIVDPYEPVQNIWVCVRYLEREFYRYRSSPDSLDLVLAAYNAGPGAVKKYGGVPPYRETRDYVRKVKALYAKLAG
jgi:hypothetical protein